MSRGGTKTEASDLAAGAATVTAVASILGNIWQASDRANLKNVAADFARQRDHLLGVLRNWQLAHMQLRAQLERRTSELERVRADLAEAQRVSRRLETENTEMRKKLASVRVAHGRG